MQPGHYHVGDGVLPPVVIRTAHPRFSKKARNLNISGSCLVTLTVSTAGLPTEISVKKSMTESVPLEQRAAALDLDDAALAAVKKYRFKPATFQGMPVPLQINIEVNFKIY